MQELENAQIYKIEDRDVWTQALQEGVYHGSAVDLNDGFIHFSTALQSRETAAKHFSKRENLIIATIDATLLGKKLIWEPSRGGALFPHLFAPLKMNAVIETVDLEIDGDGHHRFPEDFGANGE